LRLLPSRGALFEFGHLQHRQLEDFRLDGRC
jgi:hypothetical protein